MDTVEGEKSRENIVARKEWKSLDTTACVYSCVTRVHDSSLSTLRLIGAPSEHFLFLMYTQLHDTVQYFMEFSNDFARRDWSGYGHICLYTTRVCIYILYYSDIIIRSQP